MTCNRELQLLVQFYIDRFETLRVFFFIVSEYVDGLNINARLISFIFSTWEHCQFSSSQFPFYKHSCNSVVTYDSDISDMTLFHVLWFLQLFFLKKSLYLIFFLLLILCLRMLIGAWCIPQDRAE